MFTLKLQAWNFSYKSRRMCVWNVKPILGGLLDHMLIGLHGMVEAKWQIIVLKRQDRVDQKSGRWYLLHGSIYHDTTQNTPTVKVWYNQNSWDTSWDSYRSNYCTIVLLLPLGQVKACCLFGGKPWESLDSKVVPRLVTCQFHCYLWVGFLKDMIPPYQCREFHIKGRTVS